MTFNTVEESIFSFTSEFYGSGRNKNSSGPQQRIKYYTSSLKQI